MGAAILGLVALAGGVVVIGAGVVDVAYLAAGAGAAHAALQLYLGVSLILLGLVFLVWADL